MRPHSSAVTATLALALLAAPAGLHADTMRRAIEIGEAAQPPLPMPRPARDAQAEQDLIGAKIVSSDNRISGEVEEIVVRDGSAQAVIGYGGLLGLGDARVALPVAEIDLVRAGIARVQISDAQVRRLPRYEG